MSPKQQQQQHQHAARRPSEDGANKPAAGAVGATAPAASGGKLGNGMNYFAALSGISDADALHEQLEAEAVQRRQASGGSHGAAAAPPGRRSRNGEEGRMKQPLVWIGGCSWLPCGANQSQTVFGMFIFADLEMTGLDVESDSILQIAVICTGEPSRAGRLAIGGLARPPLGTASRLHVSGNDLGGLPADGSLEEVAEGPELAIHQPEEVLAGMNAWCVDQHGRSGLTQACRDSPVSLAEAEQTVLEFVQQHAPEPGTAQVGAGGDPRQAALQPRACKDPAGAPAPLAMWLPPCQHVLPKDAQRAPLPLRPPPAPRSRLRATACTST